MCLILRAHSYTYIFISLYALSCFCFLIQKTNMTLIILAGAMSDKRQVPFSFYNVATVLHHVQWQPLTIIYRYQQSYNAYPSCT